MNLTIGILHVGDDDMSSPHADSMIAPITSTRTFFRQHDPKMNVTILKVASSWSQKGGGGGIQAYASIHLISNDGYIRPA